MRPIYIITALFLAVATLSYAQNSRMGEGVSRQVTALKNMMKGHVGAMTTQMASLTERIEDLEDLENLRTACFNLSGESHIYWPNHSQADSDGCLAESEIGYNADPNILCDPRRPTDLLGGNKTCMDCLDDSGTLVDLRTSVEIQTGAPKELVCQFARPATTGAMTCPSGYTHSGRYLWRGERCGVAPPYQQSCGPCSIGQGWKTNGGSCQYLTPISNHDEAECSYHSSRRTCRQETKIGIECQ